MLVLLAEWDGLTLMQYAARNMIPTALPMASLTYDSTAPVPCWTVETAEAVLAFSTRLGGVSSAPYDSLNVGRSTGDHSEAVTENRRRLLAHLGLDPECLATAGQTHGVRVTRVEGPGLEPDCDALVTTVPGLAVAVTAADCLPIGLVARGAVGVAHSGWRGTAAGIPRATLDAVCAAAGVGPQQVHCHLGPSIRPCCYRVGDDVAEAFPHVARVRIDGVWHVDLATAARVQLIRAGAVPEHITDVAECTACHGDRYFSHRRDAGTTGRLWAVAARRATADPGPPRGGPV